MSPVQLQPDIPFCRLFGFSMLSTSRIDLSFHDACRSECAWGGGVVNEKWVHKPFAWRYADKEDGAAA
jgi:hypothetical protein